MLRLALVVAGNAPALNQMFCKELSDERLFSDYES